MDLAMVEGNLSFFFEVRMLKNFTLLNSFHSDSMEYIHCTDQVEPE